MTIAWCFQDQSTQYTDAVLQVAIAGSVLVVPAIWRLEVVNSLVVAERRKKIRPETSAQFVASLGRFKIIVDTDGLAEVFTDVLNLARTYQRSAYDASYLELAKRRGLALATRDEPLKQAAQAVGIQILHP